MRKGDFNFKHISSYREDIMEYRRRTYKRVSRTARAYEGREITWYRIDNPKEGFSLVTGEVAKELEKSFNENHELTHEDKERR